jgi:hypothetical protein
MELAGRAFTRISKLDFDRIIMNHGDIIEGDGKACFADSFGTWML